VAGRAAGDVEVPGAELDGRRRRPEPREDGDAVRSPGLRGPSRVVAEPLGLLRERDRLQRVRPRRGVAHGEADVHCYRTWLPGPMTAMLNAWRSPISDRRRRW